MRIPKEQFEELASQALDELPAEIARNMANVQVVIEPLPLAGDFDDEDDRANLLGLYDGVPLTQRGSDYSGVLPDRITLYQRNIEKSAGTFDEIKEEVRRTVIHEVAHHFGIDDDRLEQLGWA
ncbi:MAG: metallopeptidase family protein [Actinomycetota bacterium]